MMNIYSFPYLIFEQIEIILANRIQYDNSSLKIRQA